MKVMFLKMPLAAEFSVEDLKTSVVVLFFNALQKVNFSKEN